MTTRWPAISARRSRRIISSLLPLNIGPQTTSSQPPLFGLILITRGIVGVIGWPIPSDTRSGTSAGPPCPLRASVGFLPAPGADAPGQWGPGPDSRADIRGGMTVR